MPDTDTLDVLTINCNTINTKTQRKHTYNQMEDEYKYTNTKETGKPNKCNINKTGIKYSNNGDKPMLIDNINTKINYFIPGPQQEVAEGASVESMQQFCREFKDVSTEIGCFSGIS